MTTLFITALVAVPGGSFRTWCHLLFRIGNFVLTNRVILANCDELLWYLVVWQPHPCWRHSVCHILCGWCSCSVHGSMHTKGVHRAM